MRITKIKVNNFKSLVDFEIDLAKFNCLIGLNGCGKSTFLQFMDFLSQLMKGEMDSWLQNRGWSADSLPFYRDNPNNIIQFKVEFSFYSVGAKANLSGYWAGTYECWTSRCLEEKIVIGKKEFHSIFFIAEKKYILRENGEAKIEQKIHFNYSGSILSQLSRDVFETDFFEFTEFLDEIRSIHMLGLIAPQNLRQSSQGRPNTVGYEGTNLAAYIHNMLTDMERAEISRKLKAVYPSFGFFKSKVNQDGSFGIDFGDAFNDGHSFYHTTARYVNDGLLRILALLCELQ
ncbi:MAG: AAA family ATPase [Thermoguttaceae bacterium]